jgi:hypothetical protein
VTSDGHIGTTVDYPEPGAEAGMTGGLPIPREELNLQ